jgi:hypothetical protein
MYVYFKIKQFEYGKLKKKNTNSLLTKNYEVVTGMKTGYTSDGGFGIAVDSSGSNVYITGNTYNDVIIAKIPSDGGTAGTYGSFTYAPAPSNLTASTSTLSTGAASAVNSYTPTLTSSLILSSTELNASSVNNYLK